MTHNDDVIEMFDCRVEHRRAEYVCEGLKEGRGRVSVNSLAAMGPAASERNLDELLTAGNRGRPIDNDHENLLMRHLLTPVKNSLFLRADHTAQNRSGTYDGSER